MNEWCEIFSTELIISSAWGPTITTKTVLFFYVWGQRVSHILIALCNNSGKNKFISFLKFANWNVHYINIFGNNKTSRCWQLQFLWPYYTGYSGKCLLYTCIVMALSWHNHICCLKMYSVIVSLYLQYIHDHRKVF